MSLFLKDLFPKPKKDYKKKTVDHYAEKGINLDELSSLEPGTPEWMYVWQTFPEYQTKMLEYAKNKIIWCDEKQQRIHFIICFKGRTKCSKCVTNSI